MRLFSIDGKYYDGLFVKGCKRNFTVQDSDKAGRTTNGNMVRDIIGTYYNYTISFDLSHLNEDDYNEFYNLISSPTEYHVLVVPFGNGTLTYKAYVSTGEDELTYNGDTPSWRNLSVTFTAMEPARA